MTARSRLPAIGARAHTGRPRRLGAGRRTDRRLAPDFATLLRFIRRDPPCSRPISPTRPAFAG